MLLPFFLFPQTSLTVSIPAPIEVPFSSNAYGPDGPWNAVTVSFGDPPHSIDLFPASVWNSNVLSAKVSTATMNASYYSAGLFNESLSISANNSIAYMPSIAWISPLSMEGAARYVTDSLTMPTGFVPGSGISLLDSAKVRYSPSQHIPVTVGTFCLGAPSVNQSFGDGNVYLNATTPSGYLWQNGFTPSDSFGLHIGSPSLGIPGSLWFGGYDRSRVVGPVLSTAYTHGTTVDEPFWSLDLLDISVFSFQNRTGLLSQGNASLNALDGIAIEPGTPFLFLPPSVCAAMTQDLPVEYSAEYGVYLWTTSASNYSSIVNSASYFSFTFRQSTLIVNIPFPLLNLTLDQPLSPSPTQYFPCYPTSGPYTLGKAFLQAAFLGTDWEPEAPPGNWFLAQAPGPNTATAPDVHAITKKSGVVALDVMWEDTWDGFWTPISGWYRAGEHVNASSPTTTHSAHDMPGTTATSRSTSSGSATSGPVQSTFATPGNITALVVIPLVVLIVAALGIYFWKQRRRIASPISDSDVVSDEKEVSHFAGGYTYPREIEGQRINKVFEASGATPPQYLRHEMAVLEIPSLELPTLTTPRQVAKDSHLQPPIRE